MHHRYSLFFILLLLPLLNASSDRSAGCFVEYADPRDTTFEGIVRFLTESYHDGVKVVIELKRILLDPLKTLGSLGSRLEAYLPGPICTSSVHIGKQQTWTGKYQVRGKKLALVVRIARQFDTQNSDPCLQKRCHSGAICETWNDATRAKFAVCTCLAVHDLETIGLCQTTTGEVCASNGNIYASTCDMLRNACLQQTEFIIVSWTAVNQKDCQQQAELVKLRAVRNSPRDQQKVAVEMHKLPNEDEMHGEMPQQDGGYLTKQESSVVSTEPKECTYTCSITAIEPVCGSDGNTYLNPCLLNLRACSSKQASDLHIAHWGYCPAKPPDIEPIFCDSANYCQLGAMCAVGSNSLSYYNHDTFSWVTQQSEAQGTLCTCDHYRCSEKWYKEPICGDDGVTYPGDCFLNQAACIQQSPKYRLHSGPCKTPNQGVNPCLEQSCPWPGEECRVDIQGRKSCVCPKRCPAIVVPVCGSDGITYDSICHLLRTACLTKKHIWVIHAGQCTVPGNVCERQGLYCRRYEICTQESSRRSYDTALTYVPPAPKCGCPICPLSGLGGKVCGSDGRTYRSECHLRVAACRGGLTDLEVKQRGSCDACENKQCDFYSICQTDEAGRAFCACPTNCLMVNMPVCGSDGKTYDNECLLKVHACSIQKNIRVIDTKPCASCSKPCPLGMRCLGGQCVCRESCPKPSLAGEVCGTDGRIYPSACELRRQACINKVTVKVDGSGLACRKLTFALNSSASIDVQADQVIDNGCGCNKIGSRDNYCDSKGRCRCHWGVEGVKCDRCASGYWGISNGKPCVSCSCNPYGSVTKTTCDNHSGQCKCKPGIRGQQCDICPNGELMVGEECEESIPKVHKQARISNVETAREESMTRVSGVHFTPLATAVMPFNHSISPPFTFTVNFTPSIETSDAHIALLVIPSAKRPNRYCFLGIGISSGHLELSYVDELETGKMRYLTAEQKLGHYALSLSAKVTSDKDLILRITNSSTFSVFEGASSRLIRSDEYGEMVTSRGMGLILGCISQKRASGSTCGFSGCLTGVEVISYSHPGHDRRHILLSDGKAAGFSWKRPPVDNVGVCVSQIVSPLSPKTQSNTETILTCGPLNPCKNGGQCISSADRTFKKCICSPGWQGVYCQTEATIIPEFDGKAYIRLAGPTGEDSLRKRKMSMELTFLRKPDDGIIFAIPPSQTGSEFIVIRADTDGCLKVYLRVGRIAQFYRSYFYNWLRERFGPRQRLAIAKICSISNDVWHKLNVEKTNLYLTVRLDDKPAAGLRLLPQGLPRTNRDLRRALTTFDLSNSPVYLGGIPATESRFIEEYVPSKRSFVGAIQKVVLNGAELVLAGPSHNIGGSQADLQLEHWEGTVQWQGPPCGEIYSTCTRNPDSVKRICRPLGNSYECSCSTPITHMSFVRRLTVSLYGVDLLKNVTAQQMVSARAEEMACHEIQAKLGSTSKDFQHDVPSKDNEVVISFGQAEQKKTNALLNTISQSYVGAAHHRSTVLFRGSTVINYRGFIKEEDIIDNIRIQLKTDALHGLVMMIPERSHQYEEFIAISLRNGRAEVRLSLRGSGNSSASNSDSVKLGEENTITLTAAPFLADGNWHTIQLIRHKEQIALLVDDQMVSGKITGTDGILNNEGSIWLGGALEPVTKPTWPYQRNFTGCISTLFFNEVLIDLLGSADILYGPIASCS